MARLVIALPNRGSTSPVRIPSRPTDRIRIRTIICTSKNPMAYSTPRFPGGFFEAAAHTLWAAASKFLTFGFKIVPLSKCNTALGRGKTANRRKRRDDFVHRENLGSPSSRV